MCREVVPALLDPVAEPMPLCEQRLVRDLDGRGARRGVAVQRQESVAGERVDGALQRDEVDVERGELGRRNPAASDGLARDRRDPQEQLAHCLLLGAVEVACRSSARRATALRTPPIRS